MRRYPTLGPKYPVPTGPHYLVAVDLGKRKCGVAVALADGPEHHVLGAATVHCPKGRYSAVAMAHACVDAAHPLAPADTPLPWVWVCEWPKKYPDKTKFHKAIDALHKVGKALRPKWDEKYSPFNWKGNVPKAANHSRVAKELREEEKAGLPPRAEHDAWDALGILLFALGRTRRGGGKI